MRCSACQKELNRKEALYTEDRRAYCQNPLECGHVLHPNSVENILERRGAIKLYQESDLEGIIFESLDVTPEIKDRISKVATKPQSIRIQKTDLAYYLIKLQEVKGFSSISESVRFCIETAMQYVPIKEVADHSLVSPMEPEDYNPVKEPAKYIKKTGVVIIPKAEEKPKPEPEEEFTF